MMPVQRLVHRFVRYLLTAYLVFAAAAITSWLVIQLAVLDTAPSPAATAFLAGFALVLVLVALGVFVAVVTLEDVITSTHNKLEN